MPEPFDTGLAPEDYDPRNLRPYDTPWGSFTIWRLESGEWTARESFCPHLLGPLFQGSRNGDVIRCPWHDWRYSLEDGTCVHSPRDEGAESRIESLRVRVGPNGTLLLLPPPSGAGPLFDEVS